MRVYHLRPTMCFTVFTQKVGQCLLHITMQTASVQVRCFSAAIYQWRPLPNTSRHRFPLLSELFFEKNTVFGMIPRTTVLELQCNVYKGLCGPHKLFETFMLSPLSAHCLTPYFHRM